MAARGVRIWIRGFSGRIACATQTDTAPFRTSKKAVSSPGPKPAARTTFVPPVRPLSTVRTSLPVFIFTINKPNGMEPKIYPIMTTPMPISVCITFAPPSEYQYFTKVIRSGDFSRFLSERLKSLLRYCDLLSMKSETQCEQYGFSSQQFVRILRLHCLSRSRSRAPSSRFDSSTRSNGPLYTLPPRYRSRRHFRAPRGGNGRSPADPTRWFRSTRRLEAVHRDPLRIARDFA